MATRDELVDPDSVRPRLRQDAVFLRSDGGAYLRSSDTAFFLRGRSAYRWVSTLGPYLTGEHTVAELCDGLDTGHRTTVLGIVNALLERGFATNVRPAEDIGLEPGVGTRFASQVAYLQHAAPDSPAAFAAVRAGTVRVVGSGALARSVALSLVRNGVGTVELVADDDLDAHRSELDAEVTALATAGVASTASALAPAAASRRPDLVVHCAPPGGRADLLAATRNTGDVATVPVVIGSGTALLGPVTSAAGGPCWVCAQLRLAATADPAATADLWRELALGTPVRPRSAIGGVTLGAPASPSAVVAGMLGTAAAFEAFRLLAGLPSDVDGAVVVQDLETLESSRHRVFRHPSCPCCTEPAAERPATEPVSTDEGRYERLTVLVDERVGVFGRFTDDGMTQVPLKVAGLAVGSPGGLLHGRRELVAFDETSVLRARNTVIDAAVLDYVGQLPDTAEVVTGSATALAGQGWAVVPPARLTVATGVAAGVATEVTEWTPARSLCTGERVLVPLAAVYPTSAANADRVVEPVTVGAAVGDTVDDLAGPALTGALAHRALRDAVRGTAAPRPLDETEQPIALREGLAHFGHGAAVYDLPAAAPAHAALAVLGGDTPLWTLGHGPDRAAAVTAAMRDLLGLVQLRADGSTAEPGDPPLPGFDARALPLGGPGAPARPATTRAAITTELAAAGWDALLAETTTPDLRAAAALTSGVVLLAAPDGGGDAPAHRGRAGGTRTEQGG